MEPKPVVARSCCFAGQREDGASRGAARSAARTRAAWPGGARPLIRFVALPQPCVQALQEHRRRQDLERAAAGDRWVETGLVFTTTTGSLLKPSNVNKAFAELSAAAGVRRIRFHDLRHSCATLLYELGVPIENIQDVLGHSTPVITKMLYVDGLEKVQRGAADRLGELFGA